MIPGPYLLRWVGVGSVTVVTTAAVYWIAGMIPEDREQILIRFRPPLIDRA
jgi:hypothetical protein